MVSEDREARKVPGVAREYSDERITVYWEPQFCIHTANCLNAQSEVFDAMRRPWVMLEFADAGAIAAAVMTCPTGALSFSRHDGEPPESAPTETVIDPRPNGPLFVRGRIQILDPSHTVAREATRAALCRCGGSSNKPYCDGTHRSVGFTA